MCVHSCVCVCVGGGGVLMRACDIRHTCLYLSYMCMRVCVRVCSLMCTYIYACMCLYMCLFSSFLKPRADSDMATEVQTVCSYSHTLPVLLNPRRSWGRMVSRTCLEKKVS